MKTIKKIIIYLLGFVLVIVISILGNIKISEMVKNEKENSASLKVEYETTLEEYLKLNQYVEQTNTYKREYEEINARLIKENILIYAK